MDRHPPNFMTPVLSGGAPIGGATPAQPATGAPTPGTKVQLFRDHNDPPQFVCTEETCGKRFGRKEHLARHMRAHANEKPYKCPEEGCDADFTRSDLLKRHVETKHPPPTPPGSSPKRHLSGDGSNRYKKPRTTNACRGCADSKVKCDGVTPVCGRCQRRDRECVWTRPKEISPKMKSDALSDRSTPTSLERRLSEQIMMDSQAGSGIVGDSIAVQAPPHSYVSDQSVRPPFTHSLSFSAAPSPSTMQYKPSFLSQGPTIQVPHYDAPYVQSTRDRMHSQSEPIMDKPDLHSHPAGESQSMGDYNTRPGHPSFGSTAHSFVPPPGSVHHHHSFDSNFYVPPSQAASSYQFEPSNVTWGVDNPFDPSLLTNPFASLELIPPQWTENLENMVAEGLEPNMDRESNTTPSNEDESEALSQSHAHRQYDKTTAPTSHPTPMIPPATPHHRVEDKEDRLQEYVGYEYSNQHESRGAIENMDFTKTTTILLQDNARKLRATAQPCRYGNLLSGIKLIEEKRDDIKSMLDDTYAHSRLNSPSEREPPRLPRLEIFNILLKSYFHNFHPQHPILHLQSLLPRNGNSALDKKKDILVYAMCCAGAFKHSARPIQEYARGMQELLRRTFTFHFERDPRNQRSLQSLQAMHLALYVGAWSGNAWTSESAQALCGELDTMLRCCGWLDGQRGDWLEEELKEVAPGEEEDRWRLFVEREEKKRLILAQFEIECNLGSFTRARPSMNWSEFTMPVLCDLGLWRAETAEDWAGKWNMNLRNRIPRGDEDLYNATMTAMLRHFARMSADISSVETYVHRSECVRHLPSLLVGIHSTISQLADLRSCATWESPAMKLAATEAKTMLEYWWAARELAPDTMTDWLEFSTLDIPAEELSFNDKYAILFHFTAMMLHIPLREVRLMNERNPESTRRAATNRLWRTWKDKNGEDARTGLWHAGQLIRYARVMVAHDTGPPWLAPMVAEAANVFWSFAALIYHDNQLQRGNLFNGEHFQVDSAEKWDAVPASTRTMGIPSITNRKGETLTLFDPRGVGTECAEILNRGPLKKTRHAKGRTILDEQFITQLDKLVNFGNVKVIATGVR